jgi:dTDP-4-dehydrorhamnose reductase
MKILLLGCNGQVGWELQRSLQPLGAVICSDHNSRSEMRSNFLNPEQVCALVDREAPDVIVNAAAYTAVDQAESDAEIARCINATTVGFLAEKVKTLEGLLVHYSTDYIFDGSGNHSRNELDPTGPLSIYGETKLEGENLILSSKCRHLILRTSWVYASKGNNFIKSILRLAAERDSLNVVADQIGAPTGADLLADVTAHAIARIVRDPSMEGTYHCVASGETSWYEYARYLVERAIAHNLPIRVTPDKIIPVTSLEIPNIAKRPLNSRLDTEKIKSIFNINLPHWKKGVERLIEIEALTRDRLFG